MTTLTRKQQQILDFVLQYQELHNIAPTLEEIGQSLGVTRMTIHEHLGKLEAKGIIRRAPDISRSIEVMNAELAGEPGLPLAGSIRAGSALEAVEQTDEKFRFRDMIPADRECYVLRVAGDSMVEDGIFEGDYVIVEKTAAARNGDTVVAIINDDEATLKRYYKEGKRFRLQPANEKLKPIFVDRLEVRGVVRGIFRSV